MEKRLKAWVGGEMQPRGRMRVRAKETGEMVRLMNKEDLLGRMYWLRIRGTRFE